MFKRVQGETKFMYYPMTVSTAAAEGAVMIMTVGSNIITPYTAGDDNSIVVGVLRHAIAATDADYADARQVEVEVPVEKMVVWKCTEVGTGTASAADVGTYADLDDSVSVDVDNSADDMFFITKVVSQTDVRGVLNMGPECLGTIGD